ncbi:MULTISPECIES: hypothetical protein [unclassified Bradyrhizobium]|uniref:hypothetical protein n=1 Tax=unclassified Bradyrhizobium TaxID=2631580 RepID=UPI0028E47859|nr:MULTISPECIES: hypothetical protein [unclassified Bradyrhizobium]
MDLLLLRKRELERRTQELPVEVAEWKTLTETDLDSNLHWSQMEAISQLIASYRAKYDALLGNLPAETDKASYESALYEILMTIASAQRAWDFFRRKFDQRKSDRFRKRLRVADIIAIDCYDAAIGAAKARGWIEADDVREPPLTYLSPELSPMTWARGTRPNDGQSEELVGNTLPIPVVEVPYDQTANVWEFLSISHEVGHEIDADLKLLPNIKANLKNIFETSQIPKDRRLRWQGWASEIFPDLLALHFSGPAFAYMLRNVLILPADQVIQIVAGDPHPNHYIRVLLCAAYIRTMGAKSADAAFRSALERHADAVEADWKPLYGDPVALKDYMPDIPMVISGIMDSPIPCLAGATLRSLVDYTNAHEDAIVKCATSLRQFNSNVGIAPRHAVSAVRIAINDAIANNSLDAEIDNLSTNAILLLDKNAPKGKRTISDPLMSSPSARKSRIERFVAQELSRPSESSQG